MIDLPQDDRRTLEEKVALLEEIRGRREDDPLLDFQPHKKQADFINSVLYGDNTEDWFLAANRSGKSDAGAYIGAQLARFGDPNPKISYAGGIEVRDKATSGWVSALDFPTSRDTIQPKYFDNDFWLAGVQHEPFIPAREIKHWDKKDQVLRLKNGSMIGFKSADSGRKKYQGADKDWVHMDEEHDKGIYEEVSIRVGGRRLRIFGTATLLPPEGQVGGISWLYQDIVLKVQSGARTDIGLFGAAIYDNPHIPIEEIQRLESRWPAGSLQRRIRMNGEMLPGQAGSRAYGNFDRRLHVREQIQFLNHRRPLCWNIDFNIDPFISTIGQRDGRIFRVFDELVLEDATTEDMAREFLRKWPSHDHIINIYGDSSGDYKSTKSRHSDYDIIINTLQDYGTPVVLNIPAKNPPVNLRLNSVNANLLDHNKDTLIEIDPSCMELILDFEQVLRDSKQGIKKTTNKKDPYFRRTHASDGLGYWVAYEAPVKNYSAQKKHAEPKIKSPSYQLSSSQNRH